MAETRKPTINTSGLPVQLAKSMETVKQAVEMITGARPGMRELRGLGKGATQEEVIACINSIVARINASGKDNV